MNKNGEFFVQFDKKSLEDGTDDKKQHEPLEMTMKSLQVYTQLHAKAKAKAEAVAKAAAATAPQPSVPDGLAWTARPQQASQNAIAQQYKTVLYQLYMSRLPGTDVIRFLDDDSAQGWGAIAAQDLKENSLVLLPFGDIREKKPSSLMSEPIKIECQSRKTTLYIERPANFRTVSEVHAAEGGVELEHRVICPYWWCSNRNELATPELQPNLVLERGSISQALCFWKTDCKAFKVNASNAGELKFNIPYLTNPAPIKAGDRLFSRAVAD